VRVDGLEVGASRVSLVVHRDGDDVSVHVERAGDVAVLMEK